MRNHHVGKVLFIKLYGDETFAQVYCLCVKRVLGEWNYLFEFEDGSQCEIPDSAVQIKMLPPNRKLRRKAKVLKFNRLRLIK